MKTILWLCVCACAATLATCGPLAQLERCLLHGEDEHEHHQEEDEEEEHDEHCEKHAKREPDATGGGCPLLTSSSGQSTTSVIQMVHKLHRLVAKLWSPELAAKCPVPDLAAVLAKGQHFFKNFKKITS